MNTETKLGGFNSVEELLKYVETLESGYVNLMVHCRQTLDCRGSKKQIINYVHDYCGEVLEGRLPDINKD
jgi:hypothetical protein